MLEASIKPAGVGSRLATAHKVQAEARYGRPPRAGWGLFPRQKPTAEACQLHTVVRLRERFMSGLVTDDQSDDGAQNEKRDREQGKADRESQAVAEHRLCDRPRRLLEGAAEQQVNRCPERVE